MVCGSPCLHPQFPTKPPTRIVRLRAVVIREDASEAAITKQGAAEVSHLSRRFQPARRLSVKLSKLLQFAILFFRQQLNAHGRCQIHRAVFRFSFFSGIQRFPVVAKTSAVFRAVRRTINKDVFTGLPILANNIRFAARSLHFAY